MAEAPLRPKRAALANRFNAMGQAGSGQGAASASRRATSDGESTSLYSRVARGAPRACPSAAPLCGPRDSCDMNGTFRGCKPTSDARLSGGYCRLLRHVALKRPVIRAPQHDARSYPSRREPPRHPFGAGERGDEAHGRSLERRPRKKLTGSSVSPSTDDVGGGYVACGRYSVPTGRRVCRRIPHGNDNVAHVDELGGIGAEVAPWWQSARQPPRFDRVDRKKRERSPDRRGLRNPIEDQHAAEARAEVDRRLARGRHDHASGGPP
jgi:hypothetical protein